MGKVTPTKEKPGKLDVEKWIWSDADFERMGWHDVQLHGLARYEKVERNQEEGSEGHFSGVELLLDIDYILKWVTSEPKWQWVVGTVDACFRERLCVRDEERLRLAMGNI